MDLVGIILSSVLRSFFVNGRSYGVALVFGVP